MRRLPMAPTRRYWVALGDPRALAHAAAAELHCLSLVTDGATAATIRYAQLPRWKEQGVVAAAVVIAVGLEDLLATGGDDSYAAQALAALRAHLAVVLAELPALCEPGATITLLPLTGWESTPWQERFNTVLRALRPLSAQSPPPA